VLTVTASVTDGGTLTYQWYSNTTNNNTDGTIITYATNVSFTPPTGTVGTVYYYVVVANTIGDNLDGGVKTATVTSETARITVFITSPTGIEMVWIPSGSFQMGSNDSLDWNAQPAHQVTLTNGFWMGKYQVTQGQYQAVMGSNPSWFTTANGRPPAIGETDARRPVERVSWYDTIVFCNRLSMMEGLTPAYRIDGVTDPDIWITIHGAPPTSSIPSSRWNFVEIVPGSTGYRLPTEAQWEYACRAGTTTAYNTGNVITDNTGWYLANSGSRTREVGLKPANSWGLHDKHGNVWEWVWDWFGYYTNTPKEDPTGPTAGDGPVIRGGSWNFDEQGLRSAYRYGDWPYIRNLILGFRLSRP
jgi:formylglycine-generating enzyme required for sulfatase activity